MDEFVSESSIATKNFAKNLIPKIKEKRFVALFGNLGSGKTTFVQGLAEGLRIKERIISPTFIIIRQHKLEDGTFYHIDLYRVENSRDIEELGLNELVNNPKNIIALEWA